MSEPARVKTLWKWSSQPDITLWMEWKKKQDGAKCNAGPKQETWTNIGTCRLCLLLLLMSKTEHHLLCFVAPQFFNHHQPKSAFKLLFFYRPFHPARNNTILLSDGTLVNVVSIFCKWKQYKLWGKQGNSWFDVINLPVFFSAWEFSHLLATCNVNC